MNTTIIGTIIALILTSGYFVTARAQTPAQMQYEQQQREYRQQMERQQQEQQRQQQIMQENARRQQEEMNRLNRPPTSAPNYGTPSPAPNYGSRPQQQQSGGGSAGSSTTLPTGPAPAAPAPPRTWVKVASTKTQDIYADPASIKTGSSGRLMPNIRNYKEYQEKFGKSYLSMREVWMHDCDNQQSKPMGWRYYAQHNAQGTVVDYSSPDQLSGSWYQPNELGGLVGQLLKVACNN